MFFILCDVYVWWGCRGNLKLITLGSEKVNPEPPTQPHGEFRHWDDIEGVVGKALEAQHLRNSKISAERFENCASEPVNSPFSFALIKLKGFHNCLHREKVKRYETLKATQFPPTKKKCKTNLRRWLKKPPAGRRVQ